MNMIEIFLWCVVFFGIAIIQRRAEARREEHINEAIEKAVSKMHIVSIEQHGNIEYWFDKQNNEFIAQGTNLDELITHAKSRFPNHCFFFNQNEQWYKVSGPDWKVEQTRTVNLTINA